MISVNDCHDLELVHYIAELSEKAKLHDSLYHFMVKVFCTLNPCTPFNDNWHLHLLTDILEDASRNKLNRIIINIPPRSLKSTIVSVAFPAWLLARNPSERILVSSYTQMLSTKHSVDCRNILSSKWFSTLFADSRIAPGNNTKNRFTTLHNGYRFATSIGGSITGDGGDFLIIDDPHNPSKIHSKKERNNVINWFQNTLTSRINNKKRGIIILVMQRLHEHDLTGFLLQTQPKLWYHIALASCCKQVTTLQFNNKIYKVRESGDILHEKREDSAALSQIRLELGPYAFAAQYQQEPLATTNNTISLSTFQYYEIRPAFEFICISIDCAINIDIQHDYTAIAVIGCKKNIHYIIDIKKVKLNYSELRTKITQLIAMHMPRFTIIEDKAHGSAILQELKHHGLPNIIGIKPKLSKTVRFYNLAIAIETERLLLPKHAPFVDDLISEITQFPNGEHDDQIDAISQYLNWICKSKINQLTPQIRMI